MSFRQKKDEPRQKNPFTTGPSTLAIITVTPVFSDTYFFTGTTFDALVDSTNLKWDIAKAGFTEKIEIKAGPDDDDETIFWKEAQST